MQPTMLIRNETYIPISILIFSADKPNGTPQDIVNVLPGKSQYFQPYTVGEKLSMCCAANSNIPIQQILTLSQNQKPIVVTEDDLASAKGTDDNSLPHHSTDFYTGFDPGFTFKVAKRTEMARRVNVGNDIIPPFTPDSGSKCGLMLYPDSIYKIIMDNNHDISLYWIVSGPIRRGVKLAKPFVAYPTFIKGRFTDDGRTYELDDRALRVYHDRIRNGVFHLEQGEILAFDREDMFREDLAPVNRRGASFWFFPASKNGYGSLQRIANARLRSFMTGPETIIHLHNNSDDHKYDSGANVEGIDDFTTEHKVSPEATGLRYSNAWSQDGIYSATKKEATVVNVMRTIINWDNPKITQFWVEAEIDDVILHVNNDDAPIHIHTVSSPDTPTFTVEEGMHQVILKMPDHQLRNSMHAPTLFIRHNLMAPNDRMVIHPDLELHSRLAAMTNPNGQKLSFKNSKEDLIKNEDDRKKIDDDTLDSVQSVVQNLAKTIVHAASQDGVAVRMNRTVHPKRMDAPHLKLNIQGENPGITYDAETVKAHFQQTKALTVGGIGQDYIWDLPWDTIASVSVSVQDEVNELADSALHILVEFKDKVWKFTCDTVHKITKLITEIIKTIAADIMWLVRWFLFLFSWGDFQHSMEVIEHSMEDMQSWVKDKVLNSAWVKDTAGMVEKISDKTKDIVNQVDQFLGKELPSGGQPTNPIHNSIMEKGQWVLNTLITHGASSPSDIRPPDAGNGKTDLWNFFDDLGTRIEGDILKKIEDALAAFVKDPSEGLTDLKNVLGDVVKKFLQDFSDAVKGFADDITNLLNITLKSGDLLDQGTLDIPILSLFFKGAQLNIVKIVALGLAIPWTLASKAMLGHAPYKGARSMWPGGASSSMQSARYGISDEAEIHTGSGMAFGSSSTPKELILLSAFGDFISANPAALNFAACQKVKIPPIIGVVISTAKLVGFVASVSIAELEHKRKLGDDTDAFNVFTGLRGMIGFACALQNYGESKGRGGIQWISGKNGKLQSCFDFLYGGVKIWYDVLLQDQGLLSPADVLETAAPLLAALGLLPVDNPDYIILGALAVTTPYFLSGVARLESL